MKNLRLLSINLGKYIYIYIYNEFYRIFPKKVDLQAMMKYYDIDQDGSISYEEFVSGLKEALTPRRMVMVEKAFKKMDIDGSGALQVVDIGNYIYIYIYI